MKDKLFKLALVIGSLVLVGLLLESLLKHLTPRDENIVKELNELGYRGPLPPKLKGKNTYRIVAVGDSFTFGSVVPYEATYPFQLEALLNDVPTSTLKYEVINFGYPGYDPIKEAAILEKAGFDFQPDLVIIGYNLNDVSDITPPSSDDENSILMKLMRRSRLFMNGYFAIRRWLDPSYAGIIGRSGNINDMYREDNPHWIKCQQILLDLIQRVEKRDAKAVILILPHLRPFGDEYPFRYAIQQVEKFCRLNRIPVVNILPLLDGRDPVTLQAHRLDAHPNGEYYRIVATALKDHILDRHPLRSGS